MRVIVTVASAAFSATTTLGDENCTRPGLDEEPSEGVLGVLLTPALSVVSPSPPQPLRARQSPIALIHCFIVVLTCNSSGCTLAPRLQDISERCVESASPR